MTLSNFAGLNILKAGNVPTDNMRALIMGKPGSGKTRLASSIATVGKTLYVDLPSEKGTRSFQGTPWEKNIDIVRPQSLTEFDGIYDSLRKGGHGYRAVVIDSLSALQLLSIRMMQGKSGRIPTLDAVPDTLRIQQYGNIKSFMEDTVVYFYGLADGDRKEPMHVIMVAQPKVHEDEIQELTVIRPDCQPGAIPKILSTPDYILYTAVEENEDTEKWEHVTHFGTNPAKSMKARVPADKVGVLPELLNAKQSRLDLIGKKLGVGGFDAS